MKAKEISVKEYLSLLTEAGVSRSRDFALVNQDVRGGKVYFRSGEQLRNFRSLLEAAETGIIPYSELNTKKKTDRAWAEASEGVSTQMVLEAVESLSGPNSGGYYLGRCPSCARKNRDSDHNHFYFNPELKVLGCFASCGFKLIMDSVRGSKT
tara:strand:- start:2063 stop:2521 length:459 start_codon:yes stop_codon:yes gene_type:complete